MNAKELRAAAEYFSGREHETLDRNRSTKYLRGMVQHILATVYADDDEPVTVEWLIHVGFTAEPDDFSDTGMSYRRNGLHICQLSDDWHWQVGGTENFWEALADPTRVQVRRLLSALGIEVKQ